MTPNVAPSSSQPRPKGAPRPNFAQIHARPLPLEIFPLPAFIPHNPLSYLRLAYVYLTHIFNRRSSHPALKDLCAGYYCEATRSVHVTDPTTIRILWERGFFGKGSLSRSEPEWLEREKIRLGLLERGQTSADVTQKRREERREAKRERARVEREELEEQLRKEGKLPVIEVRSDIHVNGNLQNGHVSEPAATEEMPGSTQSKPMQNRRTGEEIQGSIQSTNTNTTILLSEEHLQLAPVEALFLVYTLGVLRVNDSEESKSLHDTNSLLDLFRRTSVFPALSSSQGPPPDDPFIVSYVVYHHFRSLGWVVRPGMKFAVDFLIYNRGPVFAHAEFAIMIVPSYTDPWWRETSERCALVDKKERKNWWWVHAANRVQTQVRKSLVLVYVDIPPPPQAPLGKSRVDSDIGQLLRRYRVREFCIKRWTANRSRD